MICFFVGLSWFKFVVVFVFVLVVCYIVYRCSLLQMLRLLRVLHKCQIYRVIVQKCMICAMETPYVLRRFTVNAIHSKTYFPTTEFSYAYIMHSTEGRKPGKTPCDWCWYGRENIVRRRIKCIHKYVIDIDNYCCTKINNTGTQSFPGDSIYSTTYFGFSRYKYFCQLPMLRGCRLSQQNFMK